MRGALDYIVTLGNQWFLIAGGLAGANEIAGKFLGWSWEWPRRHRLKVSVAVLVIAQVGAYINLKIENEALKSEVAKAGSVAGTTAADFQRAVREQRDENARLRATVEDRDRRILDLLGQKPQPLVVQGPPVNVYTGASGQPAIYQLSSDSSNLSWGEFRNWTRPKSASEIPISWDDLNGFTATADFTLYVPHGAGWGQARIVDLTTNQTAVETPQVPASNEGKPFRIALPRQKGLHNYVLHLRSQEGTSVNAIGRILVMKQ